MASRRQRRPRPRARPQSDGAHYAGALSGALGDYFAWSRTEDGVTASSTTYATTANVDDALAFLSGLAPGQPFILWVAFNAPHTPFHLPPDELHGYDQLSGSASEIEADPLSYYEAMIEALDTETDRLLRALPDADGDGLPDQVTVIVTGDNGTLTEVMPPPLQALEGKGSLAEHGSRVPLCVAGPSVSEPRRDVVHPVGLVDLNRTLLELLGVPIEALPEGAASDSISLGPYLRSAEAPAQRELILSEQFIEGTALGGVAVRDRQRRLVRALTARGFTERCYDIESDLFEERDLLATPATAGDGLRAAMRELVCSEADGTWRAWCD